MRAKWHCTDSSRDVTHAPATVTLRPPQSLLHISIQLNQRPTVQHNVDVAAQQSEILMGQAQPRLCKVPLYRVYPAEWVALAADDVLMNEVEQWAAQQVLHSLSC